MASDTTSRSDTFDIGGDLTVNRLGFGAMRITGEDIIGRPDDDEVDAKAVLQRAVELGVDFVDTADSYGPGVSERLIGEALGDPDDVVVASKAGLLRNREGEWLPTATRTSCGIRCCVASTGSGPTRSTCTSSTVPTRTPTSRSPSTPLRR